MVYHGVAGRLERRFGLGGNPELRRALYRRLECMIDEQGEPMYRLVATAAAEASGKEDPGRWFAKVVCLRIRESGLIPPPEL